jgi:hypothetical protein
MSGLTINLAHSKSLQLRRVVQHVKGKRDLLMPESAGMLLLDVEKAFVSVWHDALISSLTYFFFFEKSLISSVC